MLTIQAFKRIEEGQRARRATHAEETMGTLRGGNSGIYEAGEAPSHCLRKAALRSFWAIEPAVTESKHLIFDNGLNSEAKLVDDWQLALEPGQRILTQAECATRWMTSNGIPVTGSPDLVVVDRGGKPVYGLEMKNVNSVYKAGKVLKETPGADALTQAAHYSYQLGKIPWYLIYSSHTQHHNIDKMMWYMKVLTDNPNYRHIFDWATRPAYEGTGKNKVEVGREEYAKSLLGFRISFELKWEDDQVWVRTCGLLPHGGLKANMEPGEWVGSVITWERIRAYYELLARCSLATSPLPPRPADLNIDGSESSFKPCDPAYCEWAKHCKALEKKKGACMGDLVDMIQEDNNG